MSSSVISAKGLPVAADVGAFGLLLGYLRTYARELGAGLLDAKPDQAQGAALVEDDDQDHAAPPPMEMWRLSRATLVEMGREFFLADDLGEAAGGRDAAGGE